MLISPVANSKTLVRARSKPQDPKRPPLADTAQTSFAIASACADIGDEELRQLRSLFS